MLIEPNYNSMPNQNESEDQWDELRKVKFAGEDTEMQFNTTSPNEVCGFYLREIERSGRMEAVQDFVKDVARRDYDNLSGEEFQEALKDYNLALSSSLNEQQKQALKMYSGNDFKLINQVSRGYWNYDELGVQTTEKMEFAERTIDEIEQAIGSAPSLERDFVTYRGVGMGAFRDYGVHEISDLKQLNDGFFLDQGFCSTSLDKNKSFVDTDFDDTYREECKVEIRYRLPRESKDYIGLLSSELSYSEQQDEILINRNSLSYVTDVEIDEVEQRAKMEMILIPLQVYDSLPDV